MRARLRSDVHTVHADITVPEPGHLSERSAQQLCHALKRKRSPALPIAERDVGEIARETLTTLQDHVVGLHQRSERRGPNVLEVVGGIAPVQAPACER